MRPMRRYVYTCVQVMYIVVAYLAMASGGRRKGCDVLSLPLGVCC